MSLLTAFSTTFSFIFGAILLHYAGWLWPVVVGVSVVVCVGLAWGEWRTKEET
jgi:ABC-type bacteriocin/lantibiotic exporter with double-glycine peptidase domain